MARPVIADTYELACRGTMPGGETWANVMNVNASTFDPDSTTEMVDLAAVVEDLYSVQVSNKNPEWSLTEAQLTEYNGASSTAYEVPVTLVAGTSDTDPMPNEVALCVSLRTGFAGRSNRGRSFHGGWVEAASGEVTGGAGRPIPTVISDMLIGTQTFAADLQPLGLQLIVLSRTLLTWRSVTAIAVANEWATMRSRAKQLTRTYSSGPVA